MTVNHDAVAALPITGSASKTLVRNVFVARMAYVLFDGDDSRNVVLTDPSTGAITTDLLFLGRDFHYDPTDTTTAHDGTSCLVSSDGLRYKLAVGTDVFAYAVLNNTTSVPPGSPTLGDAYLVAAGATGAWAGKSNYIARKTSRGWEFINFDIGRFIYVESVDTYYHKNAGGAWVTGFGNQVTTPNSVPLSAAINFGKRVIVENQTTTAPPGSPTVGTAYIIGASATGAWAGLDLKVAICEVAGAFVIYTPTNGWAAYDKSGSNDFTFNGSAWISSRGAWLRFTTSGMTQNLSTSTAGSGSYTYQVSTAPASTQAHTLDTGAVISNYSALRTGAPLRIIYTGDQGASDQYVVALYRDSETNALMWQRMPADLAAAAHITAIFNIVSTDTSPHTYKVRVHKLSTVADATLTRREMTLEEAA